MLLPNSPVLRLIPERFGRKNVAEFEKPLTYESINATPFHHSDIKKPIDANNIEPPFYIGGGQYIALHSVFSQFCFSLDMRSKTCYRTASH